MNDYDPIISMDQRIQELERIVIAAAEEASIMESEIEAWRSAARNAVNELAIMDESEGIAGWHLNGAISTWEESGLPAVCDELQALLDKTDA